MDKYQRSSQVTQDVSREKLLEAYLMWNARESRPRIAVQPISRYVKNVVRGNIEMNKKSKAQTTSRAQSGNNGSARLLRRDSQTEPTISFQFTSTGGGSILQRVSDTLRATCNTNTGNGDQLGDVPATRVLESSEGRGINVSSLANHCKPGRESPVPSIPSAATPSAPSTSPYTTPTGSVCSLQAAVDPLAARSEFDSIVQDLEMTPALRSLVDKYGLFSYDKMSLTSGASAGIHPFVQFEKARWESGGQVHACDTMRDFVVKVLRLNPKIVWKGKELEDVLSRFHEHKLKITKVQMVMINKDGSKILLIRSTIQHPWQLPYAMRCEEESAKETALRAAQSLTGFNPDQYMLTSETQRLCNYKGEERRSIFIAVDIPDDFNFVSKLNTGTHYVQWHNVNRIMAATSSPTLPFFEDVRKILPMVITVVKERNEDRVKGKGRQPSAPAQALPASAAPAVPPTATVTTHRPKAAATTPAPFIVTVASPATTATPSEQRSVTAITCQREVSSSVREWPSRHSSPPPASPQSWESEPIRYMKSGSDTAKVVERDSITIDHTAKSSSSKFAFDIESLIDLL